jgi:hypothetical protein
MVYDHLFEEPREFIFRNKRVDIKIKDFKEIGQNISF